jgi:hypothetical protein
MIRREVVYLLLLLAILAFHGQVDAKDKYVVGGLAITGAANLFKQFNSTFATYLTVALRQIPKYENISFSLVALDFYSTFTAVIIILSILSGRQLLHLHKSYRSSKAQ